MPGRKAVTLKGWNSRVKAERDPAFAAAYREAMAGGVPAEKKGLSVPSTGTLAALRVLTYKHVLFTGKRPATQRTLRSYIDRWAATEGDKPWALIKPEHVQRRVNVFAEAGKAAAARNFLIAVRVLKKVAKDAGWKGDDPTASVELPKIRGKGYRTWTDDEAGSYEAAYLFGDPRRLIYEAYGCTALRRGDIARLGRQCVRPRKKIAYIGRHKVTHNLKLPWLEKNSDEPFEIPTMPSLQRAIDELPFDNMAFFTGPDGKPLTGKRIADILREACLAIGLVPEIVDASGKPKGLSGHGLRKRMATRLAQQCRCSEHAIAAVLGDRDLRQVRRYTAAANKNQMREDALFALLELDAEEQPGTTVSHTPATVSHTPAKPLEVKRK